MHRHFRPVLRAALPALAILCAAPALAAQERLDRRAPASPDGLLKIQNMVGSVRVIGWDRDTVAVSGTLGSGQFYFGVGKGSGKMGVELPAGVMEARVDDAGKPKVEGSVLVVRVPQRTRVWVKTASAEIDIEGVTGGLDLYAVGGRIRIRGTPQDIYAESMDGALDVEVASPAVRLRTAGGTITLRGAIENVTASSVSGPIDVSGARLVRGRFESVTGGIRWAGGIERGSSLTFESHAGPIQIAVPADVSAEFDLTAFNADITNGIARVSPRLGNDLRSRLMSFVHGEGGAHVTARNFKGTIALVPWTGKD